jgi:hypothetical protein
MYHGNSVPRGLPHLDGGSHSLIARLGDVWCLLFHRKVMLPIHGYYQCSRCYRRIPISFETERAGRT